MKPQFWRIARFTENRFLSHVSIVLSALFAAAVMSAQAANAANFYVSKTGNNADGLTWQTAWNELCQINWSKIPTGSTINLDGGPSGMTYFTTLTDDATSGSSASGIQINQSTASGHNGRVTINGAAGYGNGVKGYGIYLNGVSNVQINGNGPVFSGMPGGLEITAQPNVGAYVFNSTSCGLMFVDIDNCGTGLSLALGGGTQACFFQNVQIHDNNTVNVMAQCGHPNQNYANSFLGCTIYNSTAKNAPTYLANGAFSFTDCAIGPYADIYMTGSSNPNQAPGTNAIASFYQTLIIQPNSSSLYVGGYGNSVQMNQVTSWMTATTPSGYARAFLFEPSATNNTLSVNSSTVYGGAVSVPTGTSLSSNNSNWQFVTTGNTMALGTRIGNPATQQPFVTNVSGYSNSTPVSTLLATNFSAAPTAPTPRYNNWMFSTINMLIQYGIQTGAQI